MHEPDISTALLENFREMPRQLKAAARWVIDNPREVALLPMKEQAKKAGVTLASLTRLAQRMGYSGYSELREVFAERVRGGETRFSSKAATELLRADRGDKVRLALESARTLSNHMLQLSDQTVVKSLEEATSLLADARRIHVLGLRASYPIAYHFNYVCSFAGLDVQLLDAPGGIGADRLRSLSDEDALLAISVKPYTRQVIDLVKFVSGRGANIIAVTDSHVSPLVDLAQAAIIAPTSSPSFFHTLTPVFAVVETLAALLASTSEERTLKAVREMEHQFKALSIHI